MASSSDEADEACNPQETNGEENDMFTLGSLMILLVLALIGLVCILLPKQINDRPKVSDSFCRIPACSSLGKAQRTKDLKGHLKGMKDAGLDLPSWSKDFI